MDSIKPKPLPRFKTKRSNRYLFMLLITICSSSGSDLLEKQEVWLKKIQQLTNSEENADGYFSLDGSMLIYQSHDRDLLCDQIYTMDLSSGETKLVSTGLGATTCAYFEYPKCENIIYASTHLGGRACPPKPDYKGGYVWKLYPDYDIFKSTRDGKTLEQMTDSPGYDAEATVAFDGSKVLYTSIISGDLEVWSMNADGTNKKQVTNNEAANFAPYSFPNSNRIIFSSNLHYQKGRDFDLYAINIDGTG